MTTPNSGQQWYVKWSHTTKWSGSVDGPFANNAAPTQSVITVNGQTYSTITGPFTSSTEAQGFITSHPNGPPPESSTNITTPTLTNPVGGIFELGAVFKAFFQQITRVEMWRSLGWIALGIALILLGLSLWLRKEGLIPDAVPIPV